MSVGRWLSYAVRLCFGSKSSVSRFYLVGHVSAPSSIMHAADFGSGEGFATQNVMPSPCNIMSRRILGPERVSLLRTLYLALATSCRSTAQLDLDVASCGMCRRQSYDTTAGCRVANAVRSLQLGTAVRKLLAISHLRHTFLPNEHWTSQVERGTVDAWPDPEHDRMVVGSRREGCCLLAPKQDTTPINK